MNREPWVAYVVVLVVTVAMMYGKYLIAGEIQETDEKDSK